MLVLTGLEAQEIRELTFIECPQGVSPFCKPPHSGWWRGVSHFTKSWFLVRWKALLSELLATRKRLKLMKASGNRVWWERPQIRNHKTGVPIEVTSNDVIWLNPGCLYICKVRISSLLSSSLDHLAPCSSQAQLHSGLAWGVLKNTELQIPTSRDCD